MDYDKEIEKLREQRKGLKAYMLLKADAEDLHGCADAAMDIREIDAKISVYESLKSNA